MQERCALWLPPACTGTRSLPPKALSSVLCCVASCVQLFVTPETVAHQAPLSMGFSRQEYWRGLPCPSPGDLPNPGIEPRSGVIRRLIPSELSMMHQLTNSFFFFPLKSFQSNTLLFCLLNIHASNSSIKSGPGKTSFCPEVFHFPFFQNQRHF